MKLKAMKLKTMKLETMKVKTRKTLFLSVGMAAALVSGGAMADLKLAQKSGCLACHSVEKKVVGPAWRDVSKHYKGDEAAHDALVNKVKKGGKGNWTELTGGIPMPPYSPRVSDENIDKLVSFILQLEE